MPVEIPPIVEVDYLAQAISRLTSQHKGHPVIERYLQLLIEEQMDVQDVFKDLLQLRSIETAFGEQLDILGRIVGQSRDLLEADVYTYFGFQGASNAGGFGSLGDATVGSLFWEFDRPFGGNVRLDDNEYRLFIKAKIIKNSTSSTPEEMIHMVNFLFGTSTTFINEGVASYTIFFGRQLTDLERFLLTYIATGVDGYPVRLIPKTNGVLINFGQFREGDYFGFQGAPGAKGFGSIGVPFGGYGRDYGQSYGKANDGHGMECINSAFLDGEFNLDGAVSLDGGMQCFPVDGGWFAELIDVAA